MRKRKKKDVPTTMGICRVTFAMGISALHRPKREECEKTWECDGERGKRECGGKKMRSK